MKQFLETRQFSVKRETEVMLAKSLLISVAVAFVYSGLPNSWSDVLLVIVVMTTFTVLLLMSWISLLLLHTSRLLSAESRRRYNFGNILMLYCVPILGPALVTLRVGDSPGTTMR